MAVDATVKWAPSLSEPDHLLPDLPDPDILEIFVEGQRKSTCQSTRYDLLDDKWQKRNPLCPKDVIEDDYSEESRP